MGLGPYISIIVVVVVLVVLWLSLTKTEPAPLCSAENAPIDITPSIDPLDAAAVPAATAAADLPASRRKTSKPQMLCKKVMEQLYGRPFLELRPKWLVNPKTGKCLELDCFNESLSLAIEYNGIQHYIWPNFTGQTREEFLNQVERDSMKVEICRLRRVYLIVVPYTVKHKDIPTYICRRLPEVMSSLLDPNELVRRLEVN